MNKKGKYIESFISWQGESVECGQRMLILRVKKCNRRCIFDGKYCDTDLRMRISQEFELPFKDIQELITKENAGILLTGGECTLDIYLDQTVSLINKIKSRTYNVETNGFNLVKLIEKVNKSKNVKYILSPKLFTDNDFVEYKKLIENVKNNAKVYLKIVIENRPEIYQFLDWLVEVKFDMSRVFVMPEGTTREKILEHAPIVFDAAEKYKCNFSSREHIIYGFI